MTIHNSKSQKIFEDMKSGLFDRGYKENELTITKEDPLRYEVSIDSILKDESRKATLWACYMPEYRQVLAGVTFPDQIPKQKIAFTLALLNSLNRNSMVEHYTLCPCCNRIDAMAGISLTRAVLPKEKFQILLCVAEANAFIFPLNIIQIVSDECSVDRLVSVATGNNPEFKKYYGGQL
jgi:hypothetical protein